MPAPALRQFLQPGGADAGSQCSSGLGVRASHLGDFLGITGPRAFTRRTGRNETFNHAGNAVAALLAGGFAYLFGPMAVFYLMAVMAAASVIAVSCVSAKAIDHEVSKWASTLPTASNTNSRRG